MHYGLDGTKIKELGWKPPMDLDKSLKKMVKWTLNNKQWIGGMV
jgi:dTDP-D-glucose 4,6-dehydratase